jgi:deoxyguanosine kinase
MHENTTSALQYVVVEGCIGVGKTTLTGLLAERLGARTVVEVVEENPFLAEFYKDQVAHAFKTQMFFLLSRFKQQDGIGQADLFQRAVVADYMFAKDRIFAELTLSGSELALYDQVFHALSTRVKVPDLVVYLRAPMEVILKRIQRRGRPFEQDIERAYLENLVNAYNAFFAAYVECPVLTVDTEELNFPENGAHVDLLIAEAVKLLKSGGVRHVLTGEPRQRELV